MRKRRPHGDGADSRTGAQEAQSPGTNVENVLRDDRQERRRPAKQHGNEIQRNAAEDDLARANELEAGAQRLPGDRASPGLCLAGAADHEDAGRRCREEAESSDEGHGRSCDIEQAAQRWPDDAGRGPGRGIPRHRIGEMFLGNKIGRQCLRRRIGEGARRAHHQNAGVDVVDVGDAHQRNHQQAKGCNCRHREGYRDDQPAVVDVGYVAGEEREEGRRREGRQSGEAQGEGALGHRIDVPADGHRLHGQGDAIDQPGGAVQLEVP